MTSYAHNTTPFSKGINVFTVLNDKGIKIQKTKNNFKANPDKSNLLFTSEEENLIKIEGCTIKSSTSKKLSGAMIENKLNFMLLH